MARARNIKPGFYKNEDLAECSVWARLIFPGLWMLADREGRLEDRPKRIKGELLPFDSQDVEPLLRELEAHGFIIRYEADGFRAIQILKFADHQTPHYSEKQSVINPPEFQEKDDHIETSDSKSAPRKEPPSRGGHNPLNPDSPNPSSLNPSPPEKSARKRAAASPPPPAISVDVLMAAGFDGPTAAEFIAHKDRLKAPLTSRAWRDHIAEAAKAGWTPMQAAEKVMARGWKGFDASYVADEAKPGAIVSFRERDAEAAAQRVREMTGGVLDNRRGEVLDGLTRIA